MNNKEDWEELEKWQERRKEEQMEKFRVDFPYRLCDRLFVFLFTTVRPNDDLTIPDRNLYGLPAVQNFFDCPDKLRDELYHETTLPTSTVQQRQFGCGFGGTVSARKTCLFSFQQ